MNAGEPLNDMLMSVIRFVVPSTNKVLKKLLILYWETVEKTDADGKLRPEMILVCNALLQDLNHPNEYIRGITLKYLSKVKEREIVEPLLTAVRQNLEHRHVYVRKNAVLALAAIYKNDHHQMPDAPQLLEDFLEKEGDSSATRNALLMLVEIDSPAAVRFMRKCLEGAALKDESVQVVMVELIRRICGQSPHEKAFYLSAVHSLLDSKSHQVRYESAATLVALSQSAAAIRAAAACYVSLLCTASDNNVKLIILDRLVDLRQQHDGIMQDLVMDVLRALSSPNIEIKRKTLNLVLESVSPRNVVEVVQLLKKEVLKTQSKEIEKGAEYRTMLIRAIHQCAVRYPEVATSIIHVFMDFLSDSAVTSALDVMVFVREVMEKYPALRHGLLMRLCEALPTIRASRVFRIALWVLSEYVESPEEVSLSMAAIREALGPLPLVGLRGGVTSGRAVGGKGGEGAAAGEAGPPLSTGSSAASSQQTSSHHRASANTIITADGTYQTIVNTEDAVGGGSGPHGGGGAENGTEAEDTLRLRSMLLSGDSFLAASLAMAAVKCALRMRDMLGNGPVSNKFTVECVQILVALLRMGKERKGELSMDKDTQERIVLGVKVLSKPTALLRDIWLKQCKEAFQTLLEESSNLHASTVKKDVVVVAPDTLLNIQQLVTKSAASGDGMKEQLEIERLTKNEDKQESLGERLEHVYQLTGFSDPLYVEATVVTHMYDIMVDILIINQTNDTLQNVGVELHTLGDLKMCDRPNEITLCAREREHVRASVKVSSTETGVIFGNIVYDIAGKAATDRHVIILNEIHVDILTYITPADCTEVEFRSMWSEFEWENKVAIHTSITDLTDLLEHLMKSTNMKCLAPPSALAGDCGFLSANLYARSVFGT